MEKLILVPYDKYRRLLEGGQCGKGRDPTTSDNRDAFGHPQPPGVREMTASSDVQKPKRRKTMTLESRTKSSVNSDQNLTTPPSLPRPTHPPSIKKKHAAAKKKLHWISF